MGVRSAVHDPQIAPPPTEAAAVFERTMGTVREQWHAHMRRAGVAERDCESIRRAFLYDGLFYGDAR